MHLQVNFDLVSDVRHVGKLALIGTAEKYNGEDDDTIVTFLLLFSEDAPLATYLNPLYGIPPNTEVVYPAMIDEGAKVMTSPTNENQKLLVFTRTAKGKLRDPRKYLHATAEKLLTDLQAMENSQLWMDELADQMNWADDHHYSTRVPMPDFKRPRHD
jgi:hypothetical protein